MSSLTMIITRRWFKWWYQALSSYSHSDRLRDQAQQPSQCPKRCLRSPKGQLITPALTLQPIETLLKVDQLTICKTILLQISYQTRNPSTSCTRTVSPLSRLSHWSLLSISSKLRSTQLMKQPWTILTPSLRLQLILTPLIILKFPQDRA